MRGCDLARVFGDGNALFQLFEVHHPSKLRRISTPYPMCQGLDALEYAEHTDYDLVESTNPAFNRALVRINVFRSHRQARWRQ